MLIDTHCHLDDIKIAGEAEDIIGSLALCNLESVITVGCDMPSSASAYKLATEHQKVYSAVGMHPHDSKNMHESDYGVLADYTKNPKVIAIGEIGLDYYYDLSPRDVQIQVFLRQLELADSLNMPVIIHLRDAYGDMLELLKQNKNKLNSGVLLHCYSGSAEYMKELLKLGDFYFAFGGSLTFKNSKAPVECIKTVPRDRFMLETDSPYMTPVPYRGQNNYPKYVALVAQKAAEILQTSFDDIADIATTNAKRFFKRLI